MTGRQGPLPRGAILLPLLATLVLSGACRAAPVESGRHWTVEDVVTVPRITQVAMAHGGRSLVFVEQVADLDSNRTIYRLVMVDLATAKRREIVQAKAARTLRRLPNGAGWSVLLDIGDGLQLYRIGMGGDIKSLLSRTAETIIGKTDNGLFSVASSAPIRVGIIDYQFSPDGQWLWYAVPKPEVTAPRILDDAAVVAQRSRRRTRGSASIEFRLRAPSGEDELVTTRPSSDRLAFYYGGNVSWTKGAVHYQIEHVSDASGPKFETIERNLATGTARSIARQKEFPAIGLAKGPRDGTLSSEGLGAKLDLVETSFGGGHYSYGSFPFIIGDPRAAGSWRSADDQSAIVGMRTIQNPRYGLVWISRKGVRQIDLKGSVTACDFDANLMKGVCIEESLVMPPRLVEIWPQTGKYKIIGPLSPRHEQIAPLHISTHIWVNRLGYHASGYIVWPRGFQAGHRYPAIIVTHGSDADQRFANPDFQWNYPVQLFAERGYIVLLMNDPAPRQRADLWGAYAQWGNGEDAMPPTEMQKLIWFNGVFSFEDAVAELVKKGIVDPSRVGIAGYSRGSQMVNVAMTQSRLFRAASSGDGAFLEPSSYSDAERSYGAIFGGPPFGPFLPNYQRISPSLRADQVCGAVLQQMAIPYSGAIDFFTALRTAGVPAQIRLYPGEDAATDETHIFHIPANRLAANRDNLAWFDYWLKGIRDPDPTLRLQLDAWDVMATSWRGCRGRSADLGE